MAFKNTVFKEAYYIHKNGDKERVTVMGYDGKGQAWVRWVRDGFVNMVPVGQLEMIG